MRAQTDELRDKENFRGALGSTIAQRVNVVSYRATVSVVSRTIEQVRAAHRAFVRGHAVDARIVSRVEAALDAHQAVAVELQERLRDCEAIMQAKIDVVSSAPLPSWTFRSADGCRSWARSSCATGTTCTRLR